MKDVFPSILRNAKGFNIIVSMAEQEFKNIESTISTLDTITNLDRTPSEFLKSLGETIGYSYINSYDENIQRECLKYFLEQKAKVGTKEAIQKMATYGDIPGYLGGDLFIPGSYEDRDLVPVVLPREYLFTWSKSVWSGEDKYAGDLVYKDGTILIEVTSLNETIMKRVETVKPAGMQVVYKYADSEGKSHFKVYLK